MLAFVLRPLVVLPLLLPSRLRRGERLFVAWGGLKGAVPILLAAFAVLGAVDEADRIYGIVFVVVLLSVLVQGSTIELAAARFGVPMRTVEQVGFDDAAGSYRFRVAAGSHAAGRRIRDLPARRERLDRRDRPRREPAHPARRRRPRARRRGRRARRSRARAALRRLQLGGLAGMPFVDRVRCFRGKDAGSADSSAIDATEDAVRRASSVRGRHNRYSPSLLVAR